MERRALSDAVPLFHLFAALNPDPRNLPVLDPKDQALLLDPGSGALDYGRGHGHHGSGSSPVPANVSWLRKTEYISRDSSAPSNRSAAADMFVLTSLLLVIFSPLHILSERTSGTSQWTYRARHNSRP